MFRSPQVRGSAQATAAPASVVTRLPDWVYRTIYHYGFRAARLVWRFTKPRHFAALVMLWHDKRVLLVRTLYQDGWWLPVGASRQMKLRFKLPSVRPQRSSGCSLRSRTFARLYRSSTFGTTDTTRCRFSRWKYRMRQRSGSTIGKSSKLALLP